MATKAEEEGWLPAKQSVGNIAKFSGAKLDFNMITRELNYMLSTPAPSSWLGKWFGNKKLSLDNERLSQISSYISQVQTINEQYQHLQASLYLNSEIIREIIEGHRLEAQQKKEKQIAEHQAYLRGLLHQMNMQEHAEKHAEAQIDYLRAQAEVLRKDADIRKRLAGVEEVKPYYDLEKTKELIKPQMIEANAKLEEVRNRTKEYEIEHEKIQLEIYRIDADLKRAGIEIKPALIDKKAVYLEARAKYLVAWAASLRDEAESARTMEMVELIKYVRQNIKVSELPPAYQSFIMVAPFGSPLDAEQLKVAQELRDWYIRERQAEAQKKLNEADKVASEAKVARLTAEDTRRGFVEVWNRPKS